MSVPPGRRTLVATSLIAAAVAVLLIAVTSRPDAARGPAAPGRPTNSPAVGMPAARDARQDVQPSTGERMLPVAVAVVNLADLAAYEARHPVARAGPRARGARRGKAREPLAQSAPEPFPTSRPGPAGAGRPAVGHRVAARPVPESGAPSRAPSGTGGFLRTPWAPWAEPRVRDGQRQLPNPGQDDGRGAVERLGEHLLVGHARQLAVVQSADDLRLAQRPIRDARRVRWAARLPARRGVEYGRPTGTWTLFRYLVCGPGYPCGTTGYEWWADFPRMGMNKNWITVQTYMVSSASQLMEERLFALDYPALRAATPSTPPAATVFIQLFNGSTPCSGTHVATTYSDTEESLYFMWFPVQNARLDHLTGTPASPVCTQGPTVSLPPSLIFSSAGSFTAPQAPEPGTGLRANVESGYAGSAVFRNEHIWITVRANGGPSADNVRATVRWAKIHTSGTFVDGGVIEDASPVNPKWYIYPSISVNRRDDVLIGFTQTSATEFPSAAYTFATKPDPGGLDAGRGRRQERRGVLLQLVQQSEPMGRLQPDAGQSVRRHDAVDDPRYSLPQAGTGNYSGRWSTWWTAITAEGPVAPGSPTAWAGRRPARPSCCRGRRRPRAACRRPTASRPAARRASRISQTFSTGTPATTFVASGVPIGLYYLRVRATNNFGTSDPSNEIVLRVGPEPPGVPTGLGVSAVGSTIALTWSAPGTGGAPSALLDRGGLAAGPCQPRELLDQLHPDELVDGWRAVQDVLLPRAGDERRRYERAVERGSDGALAAAGARGARHTERHRRPLVPLLHVVGSDDRRRADDLRDRGRFGHGVVECRELPDGQPADDVRGKRHCGGDVLHPVRARTEGAPGRRRTRWRSGWGARARRRRRQGCRSRRTAAGTWRSAGWRRRGRRRTRRPVTCCRRARGRAWRTW